MKNKLVTIQGTIIYDPNRDGMKSSKPYWCVLKLPDDLVRLYQYFVRTKYHENICMPAWGAHISIVRGETPKHPEMWKKYHLQKLSISFEPNIIEVPDKKAPGSFYLIDFRSDEIMNIRSELGLNTHELSHLTIGRTYY